MISLHYTTRRLLLQNLVIVVFVLTLSHACFIRNCPIGGKKRSMTTLSAGPARKCTRCGPDGDGQCVGPNICCGKKFGCLMGAPATRACEIENSLLDSCTVEGQSCGRRGQSKCVGNNLCCSDDACRFSEECATKNLERFEPWMT